MEYTTSNTRLIYYDRLFFWIERTSETINMFKITYDFTSNWYLSRKPSRWLRNLAFSHERQPATRARTKNVVLRLVSTGWTLWSTTIFVLGDVRCYGSQKRILHFRVPVCYSTRANIL